MVNNLFEISKLKTCKISDIKEREIIEKSYKIIYNLDLFTCGIQKKDNKIRVLCDNNIWHNIQNDLIKNLTKNEIKKIGYDIIHD